MLSSVAENVLRKSKTPLCVVRRPPIGMIHGRFLVPICADDLGKAATRYAIELATNFDSSLLFCTVANGAECIGGAALLESAQRVALENNVKSESVLLEGTDSISDAILTQSGIQETDAIVMASHARDGFMRFVKGSITEAVMRASLIPVVVIR
jgi:nucleotide-binding universal stress UspA family protein